MTALKQVWDTFAHILDPALWFCAGYLGLRLMFVLARRRRMIARLPFVGHALPLSTALLLLLWRLELHTEWVFWYRLLQTFTTLLGVFVFLHTGDRLLTKRLEAEGRPNAIPRLMRDIVRGLVLMMTLFIAVSQFFKTPLGTILVSSTVFTAIVGFALQDLLKNVFAGIALQIERPFMPGDWIFIDEANCYGRVLEMSWRAIRVRPRDGEVRIIPNSVVAQRQISNMNTTGRPIAVRMDIHVDPVHPPTTVYAAMREAVLSVEGVLQQPEPLLYTHSFTASKGHYEVKFWIGNYDPYPHIRAQAMLRMWYVFQRAGIAWASEEFVVGDYQSIQRRRLAWSREHIAQRLRQIPMLDVLESSEISELAEVVEVKLFAEGEILAHQGHYETQLYVIIHGSVQIQVRQESGPPLMLSTLSSGDVFGERGMLMNEPRSADVVALEDVQAIEIDRADLMPFFERHPELPETLALILDQRLIATSASIKEHEREVGEKLPRRQNTTRSLAERIRRALFSLDD